MPARRHASEVKQIWLTASGGPFRNTPLADFAHITPAQALKHPTWVMGRRITIDSATMLNKGLEIIEACRLFDLPPRQVRVTIHPQSTVHSLVEYVDGTILAQISVTDMRLPILYALAYPERTPGDSTLTFDLAAFSHSTSAQPDFDPLPLPAPGLRSRGNRRRPLHRPQRRRRNRRRGIPRQVAFPSSASRVQLRRCWRKPPAVIRRPSPRCSPRTCRPVNGPRGHFASQLHRQPLR